MVYVMLPLGVLIGLVLGVTITAISILLVYADNKGNKIMGECLRRLINLIKKSTFSPLPPFLGQVESKQH